MQTIQSALASQSFLEKLLLLVIAGILTGILVPLVKWIMDLSKHKRQKLFEASLARQATLLQAQTSFIADFAKLVWDYYMLALAVSYYYVWGDDEESFHQAAERFDEKSWDHLRQMRGLIGSSRWFTSDDLYSELVSYFDDWIAEVDDAVAVIASGSKTKKESEEHHMRFMREMREKTDPLLKRISDAFGLTRETVNPMSQRHPTIESRRLQ